MSYIYIFFFNFFMWIYIINLKVKKVTSIFFNNKYKGCYSDHYVYNMLTADIKIIIDYINTNNKTEEDITYNKELLKCINTLNYVIKHMFDEYNNVCLTKTSNNDEFFMNNKINEKKFKKN